MSKPKVLILEDSTSVLMQMELKLHPHCELLTATTQDQAAQLFEEYQDQIDLIVIDACVPGYTINTLALVRKMRESYQGRIIASSSDDKLNDQLIAGGCNTGCNKNNAVSKILEVLDLT